MPQATRQKITLEEMRESGVRGLLIYCSDYRCSHWTAISIDRWDKGGAGSKLSADPFRTPRHLFPYISETLPTAAEVTSMAPSPSGTPNRISIGVQRRRRIHARCRIDRIFINHHWRPYNHRSANDDGTRFLDNDGRSCSVLVRLSFPLIAWNLAIGSYRHVGRRCWRGKS